MTKVMPIGDAWSMPNYRAKPTIAPECVGNKRGQ